MVGTLDETKTMYILPEERNFLSPSPGILHLFIDLIIHSQTDIYLCLPVSFENCF